MSYHTSMASTLYYSNFITHLVQRTVVIHHIYFTISHVTQFKTLCMIPFPHRVHCIFSNCCSIILDNSHVLSNMLHLVLSQMYLFFSFTKPIHLYSDKTILVRHKTPSTQNNTIVKVRKIIITMFVNIITLITSTSSYCTL